MAHPSRFSVFFLFCCVILLAPYASGDDLGIQAGYVCSNNPAYDTVAVVEIPFVVNRGQFEFFVPDSSDGAWYGRIFAQVVLYNSGGYAIDSSSTYFSLRCASPEEAARPNIKIFNQLTLVARPGVYTARLTVIDVVSKRTGSAFFNRLVVEPPVRDGISIGGARLAYSVHPGSDNGTAASGRMAKNGLNVLTNPAGLFPDTANSMYMYAEVYGLDKTPGNSYTVSFGIVDDFGTSIRQYGVTKRPKPGSTAVIAEELSLEGIGDGNYSLSLIAGDVAGNGADTCMIPFRVLSAQTVAEWLDKRTTAMNSPYDLLTLQEQEYLVRYLLSPSEKLTLSKLSDSGKVNFLEQYWREHDESPLTEANEARAQMMARYAYANEEYSTDGRKTDGWESDMGRVLMTYGPAEETFDRQAPVYGSPFVVWYYRSLEEGLHFVFEDQYGFGEYKLVHSNASGEPYNSEWAARVKDEAFFEFEQDVQSPGDL